MALTQKKPAGYEQRLRNFIANVNRVKELHPREEYLYPILNTPVFSDLETALMMAELNYKADEKRK